MFGRRSKDEYDYHGKSIDELLELSEDEEAAKRKAAVKAMGDLDTQYSPVMSRLQQMEENDGDGDVRQAASNAISILEGKPMAEEYATDEAGSEGTAFDEEVGDTSLEAGEFDVESSMDDEEEDRYEAEAEGKGLRVVLKEKNFVSMDNSGEKTDQEKSTGKVKVQNTGVKNRITGVDLVLRNIDQIETDFDLSEQNHIGVLAPGRENDWKFDYKFDQEIDPIKVKQEYYDPESGLSPNFLGDEETEFEGKITITNNSDKAISSVHGVKTLNSEAKLIDSTISSGEISNDGSEVTFDIDEISAGDSVEITLNLSASLSEDVRVYETGELKVTYEHQDLLTSGLEFSSVDGVSDFMQRVRRVQRETEPTFYDCEIILENRSEFVYDLNRFSVFAGNVESQQMVLDWDGSQATEDEREIVPNEKVAFEFVFESLEGTPTFGEHVEFSVQSEIVRVSQTEITLPPSQLKFMAIAIAKVFLNDEGEEIEEFEIPSYVETKIPTQVTLTGVGTFPLEGLVIRDEIPGGFRGPSTEDVEVFRNSENLQEEVYDISISDNSLIVNINHLEETSGGGLGENDTIQVNYSAIAENPEPQDEPIRAQAHGEGFLYEDETSRVYAESDVESLSLVIVHRRDDLDIGKFVQSIEHNGQNAYRITLEAVNYGSTTVDLEIQDLIPQGFELAAGSVETSPGDAEYSTPEPSGEGLLHGWTFSKVAPEDQISASYIVLEMTKDADPRKLPTVYQG